MNRKAKIHKEPN